MNRFLAVAALSLACAAASAQTTLNEVWRINVQDRDWFNTIDTHSIRSAAYNAVTDHVTLVSRDSSITGFPSLVILDPATGADVSLTSLAGTSGGHSAFPVNQHAHDAAGVTYVGNLTTNWTSSVFKIYRLQTETSTYTVAHESTSTLAGTSGSPRLGDKIAVTGSGTDTAIWVSVRQTAGPHVIKFTTSDGLTFEPTETITFESVGPGGSPTYQGLDVTGTTANPVIWGNAPGQIARSVDTTGKLVNVIDHTVVPEIASLVPLKRFEAFGQEIIGISPGNYTTTTLSQQRGHVVKVAPDGTKVLAGVTGSLMFNEYTNGNGAGAVAFDPVRNNAVFCVTNVSISAHQVPDFSSLTIERTPSNTGDYAAKLTNTTPGDTFLPDTALDRDTARISVSPSTQYTVSFWMRNARPELSRFERVTVAEFDSSNGFLGDVNLATNMLVTEDWSQIGFTYTSAATANNANLAFRAAAGGSSILIDDVSFAATGSPTELLTNPGFEDWPDANANPVDWRFFAVASATGTLERSEVPPPAGASDWQLFE